MTRSKVAGVALVDPANRSAMWRILSLSYSRLYPQAVLIARQGAWSPRWMWWLAQVVASSAADWLRTNGGLIHQALASLRRHDPQQREGSGVSGYWVEQIPAQCVSDALPCGQSALDRVRYRCSGPNLRRGDVECAAVS